jgi:hypothetical protein
MKWYSINDSKLKTVSMCWEWVGLGGRAGRFQEQSLVAQQVAEGTNEMSLRLRALQCFCLAFAERLLLMGKGEDLQLI